MNLADAARTHADPRSLTGQDAVALENLSRKRIAEWWDRADIEPHYPTDDATAVKLCQSVHYAIDLESLVRFCDVAAFDGVAVTAGRRVWSALNIVTLATFLECRRAWLPGSPIHAAKKTAYEIALETFRATGEAHELFNDLETYDLRALLLLLVEADNRQQREALKVAIELKLESYDIIV